MIICHCARISDHDINAAIEWMRASDVDTIITPGKIYRALGKSAECGGCMPLFLDTMRHNAKVSVPAELQNLNIPVLRFHSDRAAQLTSRPLAQWLH